MLQKYLNANLLSITEDEDVKKLQKSSEDIVKKVFKNKSKIVSYTLAAIDPNVSASNLDIIEAKDIIIRNWNTFNANTKDTPLTYVRAVILEALNNVAQDLSASVLIWFASRNIVKHYSLLGEEKSIVISFLTEQGEKLNKQANNFWAFPDANTFSKTSLDLKQVTKYLINDAELQKYLEDASGPHNSASVANYETPNPHWPNTGASWSYEFAPRAAKAMKGAIDVSLKAIVSILNENQTVIQSIFDNNIDQVQKNVLKVGDALQLRSELLWWKEASYSPLVDKSYREVGEGLVEIILAKDYASFVPVIYPKSADYFLKETYLNLNDKEEIELKSFIDSLEENSTELRTLFPETNAESGKITLLSFLLGIIWGKYKVTQFEEILGFASTARILPAELTLWLFHDFQLLKAVNIK